MRIEELSLLHDLHPAAGLVNCELPLGKDRLELVPRYDIEPVVLALGKLDAVGTLNLPGLETLVLGDGLRLLDVDAFLYYDSTPFV